MPQPLTGPQIDGDTEGEVNPKVDLSKRDPRRLRWAELLKRVFQIDLTTCPDCGGQLSFIAAVMKQDVVLKILVHLKLPSEPPRFHAARAPPQTSFWDDQSA